MSTPQPLSILDLNKQLAMRWFEEVWNQGRRETIHELFAPEGVLHDGAATYRGPEEFLRFYEGLRSQFCDFRVIPLLAVAEGDLACLHWSAAFRHAPTDKPIQITGTSIVRVRDGQFVEAWQNWDAAGLVTQLTGNPVAAFL